MLTKTVVVLLVVNFLCVQGYGKKKFFPTKKSTPVEQDTVEIGEEIVPKHIKKPYTEESKVKSTIVDEELMTDEEKTAIKNAKYTYGYVIDDKIEGGWNEKFEERENGKVKGHYTYDDMHVLRKVTYEADEDGFRVISDEILPSQRKDIEMTGTASVKTMNNDAKYNEMVIEVPEENSQEPVYVKK